MSDSTQSSDGVVRVTLRDVYNSVNDLATQIDGVVTEMRLANERAGVERATVLDHEVRIRALERRVWQLPSLAAVLGLAGVSISLITMIRSFLH